MTAFCVSGQTFSNNVEVDEKVPQFTGNQNGEPEFRVKVEERDFILEHRADFQNGEPGFRVKVEERDFILEHGADFQSMDSALSLKVEENAGLFEPVLTFKVEENELLLEPAVENQQTLNGVMVKEEHFDDKQIIQESIFVAMKEEPYDDYGLINKLEDGNIFNYDELLTDSERGGETAPAFHKDRSLDFNCNRFLEQKNNHQTEDSVTSSKKKKCVQKPGAQRSFPCDVCQKSFKYSENLRLHLMFHNNERPFSCDTCGKRFVTNSDLRRHRVVHTGQKPYACTMCSKSFTQQCNMQAHLRNRCQAKRFGCSHCNRMFEDQHSLTKHETNHSTLQYKKYKPRIKDRPPYFCDVCSMSFNGKRVLIAHMRTHFDYGDDEVEDTMNITSVVCQICGKDCVKKKYLVAHVRTHTGEKPFVCNICGKAFSQKCNLKKHKVLHLPD